MSYRASVLSPIATSGLGTMPGSSSANRYGLTTYSNAYSRHSTGRSPSATRNFSSTYTPSRTSSTSRPLPTGPGPLDHSGRKLSNYSTSDFKRSTNSPTTRTPLKADHSFASSYKGSGIDYSTSVGTLQRKYSSSDTTKTDYNRNRRAQSLAAVDREFSHLTLNGHDSIKASPRTVDSDDSLLSRASRKDRYNTEQKKYDDSIRTGSRVSRISSTSDYRHNDDDVFSPRAEYHGRSSSVSRDSLPLKKKDSFTDTQTKSLSRQSSSSSISTQTSVSKYSSTGKVGLRNIGNTCFMNSILQCLSNTKPLLDYCLKQDYILDENKTTSNLKGALIIAYANLISSFWKEKNSVSSYVNPSSFKSQIQKFAPRFTGYQQQDAQEFLRYLLEGLHEDVNRVTSKPKHIEIKDDDFSSDSEKAAEYWRNYLRYDHSRIVEIFVGQLKSELKFDECGHRSVTFDPFWDLSLPIPKMRSECDITDCLSLFMKEEILDGHESPTCAKCKKRRSCTKRFSIQKFPPVLVLHLKRFSQERYSRKITSLVNFPITTLDLSEFASEKGVRPVYNLYAVSEHSGTTYGGHYTARCKHAFNGEWNYFNDARVTGCGANQAVSSEAYVLFYELVQGSQSRL